MKSICVIDSEPIVRLRSHKADLVITNVFLRNIAGHEALRTLKTEFPQVPVLMVSGLPDEKTIADWILEPGFDVFPKPFLPKDLLRKVEEMVAA